MTTDRQLGESISRWLEETAPGRLPDRVLEATFERTARSRQRWGWRVAVGRLHFAPVVSLLGGVAVIGLAVGLGLGLSGNQPGIGGPGPGAASPAAPTPSPTSLPTPSPSPSPSPTPSPTPDPRSAFLGTWISTSDADGSTQTMTVTASAADDGTVEIVVVDTIATACSGTPSTMTGAGRIERKAQIVMPAPGYTCDDGSQPKAQSGPPLEEQLRNLTFVRDAAAGILTDMFGGVWLREGAEPPRPTPPAMTPAWPQTTLEEARQAQERADARDPRYTWQVAPNVDLFRGPYEMELLARFLREELGWEEFRGIPGFDFGQAGLTRIDFIRCAASQTNPLYPNDPEGGECAPTLDEVRYETVRIDIGQPVREGPTGIWVVTRWETVEPFEQLAPPSGAEATDLLEAFLEARVAGTGAEASVDAIDRPSPQSGVPLLYATTTGARYERFEFEMVDGPVWPDALLRYRVRLFADGRATVVEQLFLMERDAGGRLRLQYEYNPRDLAPTTENGDAVPVEYGFATGEVGFEAAWPWYLSPDDPQGPGLITLWTKHDDPARHDGRLAVVADPRPIGSGCAEGPAPADLEALVASIRSDPDLDSTDPVAATLGGLPALQLDVEQVKGSRTCEMSARSVVVTAATVDEFSRMRLWLVDLPGPSPRIVAIALTASKEDFERVLEAEAPLLESFRFQVE